MATPGFWRVLKWVSLIGVLAVVAVFGTLGYNLGPAWYAGIAGAVLPLVAYIAIRRRLGAAEIRTRARLRWGASGRMMERPSGKEDTNTRGRYLGWTAEPDERVVDERTWRDLAMDEVFQEMDVSATDAGRNELYRLLHHCLPAQTEVKSRLDLVEAIGSDTRLRDTLLVELAAVGREKDADPASFLWAQDSRRDRLASLFIGMGVAAVVSVVAIPFLPTTGLLMAAGVFVVNMVLYYGKARHLSALIPTLRVL